MIAKNNLLLIANRNDVNIKNVECLLRQNGRGIEIEYDIGEAIQRLQNTRYNVIVIDANLKGIKVEKAIRILKNLNPHVKIIVKTVTNSKCLEARIRNEKIYYYHVESFGIDDLKNAIQNALNE